MRYDQTPRPLVENHYHIRELIERQEQRSADRTYHRDKEKQSYERDDEIRDAKFMVATDFWCHHCRQDFKSVVVKQVEVDWSNTKQRIAFYKAKCDAGHWCIRLITDKNRDGFWVRSKAVARDMGEHFADTLQPHQTGFNMLYKKL
jgi:hypothetical protein